uniref:DUF4283 domain-containing protein n=1 Tax=Cajanus cajan TaxID=3821 RepID=A0A151S6V4_CAJCA|nr:hypothetical protein KK1_027605 [Cajanus cajan]
MLDNKIQREWVKNGAVRIVHMSQNFYLVQFASEDDYKHPLFEGPWLIVDHYIMVQRWRPFFISIAKQTRKVAAWIHILGLSIELFNDRFLWRVGNKLGTMLKIDKLTSIQSRGRFARICVEIDLQKKLVSQIDVLGHILNLKYEGLHSICFKCGKYGHKQSQFSQEVIVEVEDQGKKHAQTAMDDDATMEELTNLQGNPSPIQNGQQKSNHNLENLDSDENYGPWMIVK